MKYTVKLLDNTNSKFSFSYRNGLPFFYLGSFGLLVFGSAYFSVTEYFTLYEKEAR